MTLNREVMAGICFMVGTGLVVACNELRFQARDAAKTKGFESIWWLRGLDIPIDLRKAIAAESNPPERAALERQLRKVRLVWGVFLLAGLMFMSGMFLFCKTVK